MLDLVLHLQIERELHDGFSDDRVDHRVEAVGVQAVEEKRPALAGGLDRLFLTIGAAANCLRLISRVGVVQLRGVVDRGLLRVDLGRGLQLDAQNLFVPGNLVLGDGCRLLHESILDAADVLDDIVNLNRSKTCDRAAARVTLSSSDASL